MGIKQIITRRAVDLIVERPAAKLSFPQLEDALQIDGLKLDGLFAEMPDTAPNRRLLSHIIGIEAWGTHRLRVALGDPLVLDEYDAYRPPKSLGWRDLQKQFRAQRQQTLDMAMKLDSAHAENVKVAHNQYGQMTTRGWLYYLNIHANIEARYFRG
ncbi:MAG: DinB family protein [Anaerolineae bacterium]